MECSRNVSVWLVEKGNGQCQLYIIVKYIIKTINSVHILYVCINLHVFLKFKLYFHNNCSTNHKYIVLERRSTSACDKHLFRNKI